MKLGNLFAVAVLMTPLPFVGMAQPAWAHPTHTVAITGALVVENNPVFGKGSRITRHVFREVNLTHGDPKESFLFVQCAGGESRGELRVTVDLIESDRVTVSALLNFFEGSTCGSTDLEEFQRWNGSIAAGESVKVGLEAYNHEFQSNDGAVANFTVTHNVPERPAKPTDVRARAVRVLCVPRLPCSGKKEVVVKWVDNSVNEIGYSIRDTTTGETVGLPANTTEFTWSGLDPQVKHCFLVRANGDAEVSEWSAPIRAILPGQLSSCA
ncbi:fibronectin type III domain-containing protein [Streptomyces katrae]|uniref:Fibronectin type-III domain-containing protein n=1 Tax=Streptomyces katrae TaxID=68223 RepID=A0A0F4J100_9ACTN|nr:fibronectin type III domain-containing protein [Streptomyces katrae]KJY26596.1 hypothetical protein VR44_29655 [Streptomyces katrae]